MGTYINIGNAGFQRVRNSEYVDKSGLISIVNGTLFTERSFSCVSRSRRFGKSVAAKMLCAYYDQSCDSRSLFTDLEIASDPSFEKHLNKYPVIFLDLTNFTTRFKDDDIMEHVQKELMADIHKAFSDIPVIEGDDLMTYLIRVTESTQQPFIFIIDEWDAICREFKAGTHAMDEFVSWLRRMFKGSNSPQDVQGEQLPAGVCRCLYDRYPAHQEIQDRIGTEQFHRVFYGQAGRHGQILWFYKG